MKKKNLNEKIKELEAGWQRTQADFDNYKKKTEQDKINWVLSAKEETLFEILPVLDNLCFAFKHKPLELKDNSWVTGLDHISNQIDDKLREQNIERISPEVNEHFNPAFHEALTTEERKGTKSGRIIELIRPGYKIGEKVVRPAQVKVSK